jgi:hypothetical protein
MIFLIHLSLPQEAWVEKSRKQPCFLDDVDTPLLENLIIHHQGRRVGRALLSPRRHIPPEELRTPSGRAEATGREQSFAHSGALHALLQTPMNRLPATCWWRAQSRCPFPLLQSTHETRRCRQTPRAVEFLLRLHGLWDGLIQPPRPPPPPFDIEQRRGITPLFPALRFVPMALSGASRVKQIPSSQPSSFVGRDNIPVTAGQRRFIRLRVTR